MTLYRDFSTPTNPYHRRYGHCGPFVEDDPKGVAKQFGYEYSTMRQLVYEFRQHCRNSGDGPLLRLESRTSCRVGCSHTAPPQEQVSTKKPGGPSGTRLVGIEPLRLRTRSRTISVLATVGVWVLTSW
jgi:hypothetical protein